MNLTTHDTPTPFAIGLGQWRSDEESARRLLKNSGKVSVRQAPIYFGNGPVKEVLLDAACHSDADVLIIGRGAGDPREGRFAGSGPYSDSP